MRTFRDNQGRTWTITLSRPVRDEIRERFGVDIQAGRGYDVFTTRPETLIDCLFICCRGQADRCGMTAEQFGECLPPDQLPNLAVAFVEAIYEILPRHKRQKLTAELATIQAEF